MFTQGFGEVLTDVMTVNPALDSLPAASSILDTSNYTFQAVTFGKDAAGYNGFHAHAILSATQTGIDTRFDGATASSYDLGRLEIVNHATDTAGASSYFFSSTYYTYSGTYDSMPNYPSISDTRLERGSTKSSNLSDYHSASLLPDLGHYPNAAIDPLFSSVWNKVGGFAPEEAFTYTFYDEATSSIQASLTGNFNSNGVLDKDGYLTVNPSSAVANSDVGKGSLSGAVLVSGTDLNNAASCASLQLSMVVSGGDAASLAAFGGVEHIGIYCLNLKDMLASGLLPPYDWNALNNTRKYKLVSKFTFLTNALYHGDMPVDGALKAASGFRALTENERANRPGVQLYSTGGPQINLMFNFK